MRNAHTVTGRGSEPRNLSVARATLWRFALLGILLSTLFVAPVLAQEIPGDEIPVSWQGTAGLLVSVVDDQGAPLPDVRVALRLGEGPEWLTTTTEADGRARFEGLAEGEWEVDVRREGFMLFSAFVALETGRKPKVAFSSRQRTGTYWEPLQAVFLPPDVQLTRGMSSGRQSVDQALAEQRRREKQEQEAERRARRAARRGELARVEEAGPAQEPVIRDLVEPTRPTEEPRGRVGQSSAQPAAPVPSPAAPAPTSGENPLSEEKAGDDGLLVEAGESDRVTVGETPFAAAQPAERPDPRPDVATTAEPTTSEPVAELVTRSPSSEGRPASRSARFEPRDPPRRLLVNPNLRPAGACPECAPGEFSVASRSQAERWQRGAACGTDAADALAELSVDLIGALDAERRAFAGSLRESNGNDLLRLLPDALRDEVAADLDRGPDHCVLVGVVLPAGARYVGFRYQVGERSVMAECPDLQPDGAQECQLQDARWLGPPRIVEQDGMRLVLAVFENRSRRSTRLSQLVVYFEPPHGWLPPSD